MVSVSVLKAYMPPRATRATTAVMMRMAGSMLGLDFWDIMLGGKWVGVHFFLTSWATRLPSECSKSLAEQQAAQPDVDLGIYLVTVGLEPGCLCGQYVAGIDHAFAEA